MQRSSLLLAVLSCLAPAATAQAQTQIQVNVDSFTGRTAGNFDLMDLATVSAVPITQDECDAMAEIAFSFTMIDTTRSNLHFYEGAGCDDVTTRTSTTTTQCQPLDVPPVSTELRSMRDVSIPVNQLVPCGDGGSGVVHVFVLAVNNVESDEVSGTGQLATFDIAYDFEGPAAPGGFQASGGETSITLEWTGSSDQVTEYEVYVDPDGCSGGALDPESALAADPENPPMTLLVTTIDGPSEGGSVPFPASVPIPGEAAVAIRSVDRNGNVGSLSTVRCVERFEVTSWLEMYCMDGSADACGDATCAASPGYGSSSAPLVAVGLVVGVALLRRRRR